MKKKTFLTALIAFTTTISFAQKPSKKDYLITMNTNLGEMKLILFEDTPLHRANFLKLVEEAKFDSVIFHRVIKEFMIQGGNLGFKTGQKVDYKADQLPTIPYEFVPNHVHKKGALAAARTNNPEKASSGSQFYIVTGKKYSDNDMKLMSKRTGLDYTIDQVQDYMVIGGTPFLDNNYTVFGEVIEGIKVAEKIENVKTARGDKPLSDVWMTVSSKKMKKKKITKLYGYKYEGQ